MIRKHFKGEIINGIFTLIEKTDIPNDWVVECKCGNRYEARVYALQFQNGCRKCKIPYKDLTGQNFGKLTVLSLSNELSSQGRFKWNCQCSCGNVCIINRDDLISGSTKSCGCISKELGKERWETHGKTKTPEFKTWMGAKARCFNPNDTEYHNYGSRGITMSDEWKNSFETFLKDMGERPSNQHSIERIENDKNYCKENCRWADKKEQARNRRTNILISINEETKTLIEWSETLNISYGALYYHYSKNKSIDVYIKNR